MSPAAERTLHTAPPAFGVACASPFCVKVEVLLAYSGLPHRLEPSDPRKGPRGKIPFLVDGAEVVPDSRLIARHLEERYGARIHGAEGPRERAVEHAALRMVEEHLYWAQVYFRWEDHPARVRDALFAPVPAPLRWVVFGVVARGVRANLRGQGLGRMTRQEILDLARADLDALEALIDDGRLFARSGVLDASLYGVLDNLLAPELPGPLQDEVRAREGLMALHARVADELARARETEYPRPEVRSGIPASHRGRGRAPGDEEMAAPCPRRAERGARRPGSGARAGANPERSSERRY